MGIYRTMGQRVLLIEVTLQRSVALERFLRFWFSVPYNTFVYEMGLQEPDLSKRAKIDYLKLSSIEWSRVGQFADLLSVRTFEI
jgi:hypothetical protein